MSLRLRCFPSDLSPPIQCVSHLLGLPPSFTVQSLAAVVCLVQGKGGSEARAQKRLKRTRIGVRGFTKRFVVS
ncbi:unnamed protein product [Microthlaspi erraticum]|uniref:Uncharacterized protein n=1 Tax=Microthlaspi erraticum TaxID=1685480 RepID=A0A6D2JYY1_9BRAS|nr:unnamed protein product [Microthlaspi erraticum]